MLSRVTGAMSKSIQRGRGGSVRGKRTRASRQDLTRSSDESSVGSLSSISSVSPESPIDFDYEVFGIDEVEADAISVGPESPGLSQSPVIYPITNVTRKRSLNQISPVAVPVSRRSCHVAAEDPTSEPDVAEPPSRPRATNELREYNKALVDFFRHFDAKYPINDASQSFPVPEGTLKRATADILVSPWRHTMENPSSVDTRQEDAKNSYRNDIAELEAMGQQLETMQEQVETQRKSIRCRVEAFLRNLEQQPAHSFLGNAKSSVLTLVAQGNLVTARYITKGITDRLDRDPPLLFSFDLGRDLPGRLGVMIKMQAGIARTGLIPL